MVRDEPSASGQKPSAEPDSTSSSASHAPQARTGDFTLGTGNLTQELAQLLAATIAHNQAQRGMGGGVPTGADLASLASLMQAASAHRTLAPTFKDGLSALSYSQPHARSAHAHSHPQGALVDHGDPHHDDEPMPIPSTWRQPVVSERDRWFRQQMGAAILGLVAGLMIVVPTVLWLSGWIGGAPKQKMASVGATATGDLGKAPEIKPVKVQVRPIERQGEVASQLATGSFETKSAFEPPRKTEPTVTIATAKSAPDTQASRTDDLLAMAARRIENGDIAAARELLAGADGQALGPAAFALAETYDPNMLAAWGTRGAVADVAKARALYSKALVLGVSKAQVRLEGLK